MTRSHVAPLPVLIPTLHGDVRLPPAWLFQYHLPFLRTPELDHNLLWQGASEGENHGTVSSR